MKLLEIISGQDRRPIASCARLGLSCLTPVYRTVIGLRNWWYHRAIQRNDRTVVRHAEIPVISVGNLTTGGTGKTPHVLALARTLRDSNLRVALVSRGYGMDKENDSRNDEAMELEIRLPDVPHLQNPDRYAMTKIAFEELESEVVLLDDGFQHRQLHRDLDIVIVDATLPFGYGRLLPRGLLREPISSLRRADWVILSRSNLVEEFQRLEIRKTIEKYVSPDRILETSMVPSQGVTSSGDKIELSKLRGPKTFAVCGIGNPENFLLTLTEAGFNIVGSKIFSDHHGYQREDVELIGCLASESNCQQIICTEKDLVKLSVDAINGIPLAALSVEAKFCSDPTNFFEAIKVVASQAVSVESPSEPSTTHQA